MPLTLRQAIPRPVKSTLKSLMFRMGWEGARPSLVGHGTVQDLYYWVSDGQTDTNVLLNNFYSVFFPTLETDTTGTLTANDPSGKRLGMTQVRVGHLQCVKLTLSQLLPEWLKENDPVPQFGTILLTLEIPPAVLSALSDRPGSFYFWHRFYIEYVTVTHQPAFVHCVDKTLIYRHGSNQPTRWYPRPQMRDWAPEMPLNIDEYRRVYAILMNRTPRVARVTLTVEDTEDRTRQFSATIPPNGVHRFELSQEILRGLAPRALRMRVSPLPTTWARPVLFKEFETGAISAMHC